LCIITLSFYLPSSFVCFVSCLAEINQITFDFAKDESELVSVFKVEFGGGGLALNFLVEYAIILCMRLLFCIIFFWGGAVIFILYSFMLGRLLCFSCLFVSACSRSTTRM
jgi:NADH:ubiquinone oxidoreductase subunit H